MGKLLIVRGQRICVTPLISTANRYSEYAVSKGIYLFDKGLLFKKLLHDLAILVGVGTFIGLLSPFGMDDNPLYLSVFYWVSLSIFGYMLFAPSIHVSEHCLNKHVNSYWIRISIGAFFASIGMSFFVPILTWFYMGYPIDLFGNFFLIFPNVLIIGAVITLIYVLAEKYKDKDAALTVSQEMLQSQRQALIEAKQENSTQLIEKLPVEKRGELICLEMSDHYVKVYTDKGHEMLLMRFKDALNELNGYAGIQTHRSWWVATSAVTASAKQNRKIMLTLNNGLEVPVSRTYIDNVKRVGLI